MKIKNAIILLFLSLLYSCFTPPTHGSQINYTRKIIAQKLWEEKDLYLCGTGGAMMDDIQTVFSGFDFYHGKISLEEARALIVYVIQEHIQTINQDKWVRPYLHDYPINEKNLEIDIYVYKEDGSEVSLGDITHMCLLNGILVYRIAHPNEWTLTEDILLKETYAEALEKLEMEKRKSIQIETDKSIAI